MSQKKVAYFCMEYGLDNDFKIYSGGLGILAGDILKAAKDLEKDMVAVGILWRQGYTNQYIAPNAMPMDCYPEYRYDFLEDTGVEVEVNIRKNKVKAKVWLCKQFGNVPLYLLDAFIEGNNDMLITGQLYGWFSEERIAQEILLGVGGLQALEKLGIKPDIYHFNDSHPMFAGLELIKKELKDGVAFETAIHKVRKSIVFTTHTPVEAGNEVHDVDLLKYMQATKGLSSSQIKSIGGNPFNMTVAGLHLSYIANGVSELHGEVARQMWSDVKFAAPIIAVTNGVHNGTWQDSEVFENKANSEKLWARHQTLKAQLFDEIEKRNGVKLDENVLTIGFARRAAPYKRGNLIFSKPEIIEPLLKEKKLQLIFSGKAHPNDLQGKEIVSQMYKMAEKYKGSVIFLQNYDMTIGKLMTRGCDIWLNNPLRPMEASGTSGMKAAMNGVLNFSVLDGWWPEGCEHGVNGWQIGDGYEGKDQDEHDANSLYNVLLNEIIPTYNENAKWTNMMNNSIEMSSYKFSAQRMVEDYYELMYTKQPK